MSAVYDHRYDQEVAISLHERRDSFYSTMNQLAEKMELLKRYDPPARFTTRCKHCGYAQSVSPPEPKAVLSEPVLDIPIAPLTSADQRLAHEQQLTNAYERICQAEIAFKHAQQQLENAREAARAILNETKSANNREWIQTMSHFSVNNMILLTSGEVVRIHEIRASEGRLVVTPCVFIPDPDQVVRRNISYRAVALPDTELFLTNQQKVTQSIADYEHAKHEYLTQKTQTCPMPCAKCGHIRCYSMHYANRSDLGGWEMLCCASSCPCFNCKTLYDKHKLRYDYGCCQCDSRVQECECALHRKW